MIQNVLKVSRNVLFVEHDTPSRDWEQWYLLRSDVHHDSKFCNRELELEHLARAVELNAGILDFGDLFDVMQSHHDPRRSYSDMRPEYAERLANEEGSYFDIVVEDTASFYAPFASNIKLLGKGNHETKVEKHNDINLIERLAQSLYMKTGVTVPTGGYGGWVKFQFEGFSPIHLKYFHGAGDSNAAVTRGVIDTNRQAVFLPDADIVVNGHNHESWVVTIPRERISQRGIVDRDLQWHVRTPTYKDEYRDGSGGWHVEQGKAPKPVGAVWLKFYTDSNKRIRFTLTQEIR